MRENAVKRVLSRGGIALGTMMFEFPTTGVARVAAAAGADFAIFDMEHTGWSIETIRMLMSTSRAANLVPMVRVPAAQYHLISRPLDVGAMGIMVPMVASEADARLVVQSGKYPPVGRRGAAFGVAHDDYQSGDLGATLRSCNDEVFLIAQIETTDGLESVEKIAAVDGIDCLWIGHFDLTNSMGIPGQFTHPRYLAAVERIVETTRRHGKAAGFMVASVEQGRELLAKGFRILAYWGDLWIYQQGLRQGLQGLRASART